MSEHREFVASFEHMGAGVWSVDQQFALEGEATEIVRCRDCKHYYDPCCNWFTYDPWDERTFLPVDPNGFCAWGERRA